MRDEHDELEERAETLALEEADRLHELLKTRLRQLVVDRNRLRALLGTKSPSGIMHLRDMQDVRVLRASATIPEGESLEAFVLRLLQPPPAVDCTNLDAAAMALFNATTVDGLLGARRRMLAEIALAMPSMARWVTGAVFNDAEFAGRRDGDLKRLAAQAEDHAGLLDGLRDIITHAEVSLQRVSKGGKRPEEIITDVICRLKALHEPRDLRPRPRST